MPGPQDIVTSDDELRKKRAELQKQVAQKQLTVRERVMQSIEDSARSIAGATEAHERSKVALKMLDDHPIIEEFLNLIGERKPKNE